MLFLAETLVSVNMNALDHICIVSCCRSMKATLCCHTLMCWSVAVRMSSMFSVVGVGDVGVVSTRNV